MASSDARYVPSPYRYGFSDPEEYLSRTPKGLTRDTVTAISTLKGEPDWMLAKRLEAFEIFSEKQLPAWGADLSGLDFDSITYFLRRQDRPKRTWDDVPDSVRTTFERIGVPEAEREFLAGVSAQYESESVYHNLREEWERQGVIFVDTDTALQYHGDVVRQYFGTIVPSHDHKFAALNTAVWSGGSFVYVPKGVRVEIPLQAYFRINAQAAGQFERTLIVAEEGSFVHYVEGCSAPVHSADSLHSAVVEVIVKRGARVRYTTIQNWSGNVYNLVTKRAAVYGDGTMEWIDCNLGSKATMKYPAAVLIEPGARAEVLSLAVAGEGQHQDAGAKMVHLAPHTSSVITSKSVSWGSGRTTYRGIVKSNGKAAHSSSKVTCDALLLDPSSRSDTYPTMDVRTPGMRIEHEATVSRLAAQQLFYARSRGLSEAEAVSTVINGFLEPVVKELPMEYAVEMNRLIELQMEGSVG